MGLQMLTPRLSKIRKTKRLERFGVKTHTYVGLPNHRIASSCDRTLKRNQQMSVNFVRCIFSNIKSRIKHGSSDQKRLETPRDQSFDPRLAKTLEVTVKIRNILHTLFVFDYKYQKKL